MTEIQEFTHENIKKGPFKGEQIRKYHKWLKEQREKDKKELKNQISSIYRIKKIRGKNAV